MGKFFTGHGIEIIKKNSKYFLIYDAGEITDRMETIEITEDEAHIAKQSSIDAYNVIIKHQNDDIHL